MLFGSQCFTVRIPRKTSLCGSETYSMLTRKVCGIPGVWMACIPRVLIRGVYLHPRLPCQRHNASAAAAVTAVMTPALREAGAQRLPRLRYEWFRLKERWTNAVLAVKFYALKWMQIMTAKCTSIFFFFWGGGV